MQITFDDMLDSLLDYAGSDTAISATTRLRRAIFNAYHVIATRHEWTYYRGLGRINTNASYSTGTVAFDLTGGANERQLTLSGGTWPSWAASGYVVIDNVPYQVDTRVSDTIITLASGTAPTADIAAGETYEILQDRYALPTDFVAGDEAVVNDIGVVMQYIHPREWSSQRRVNAGPGQPTMYTFIGNPAVRGGLAMAIWPPADSTYAIDFLYKRRPRELVYSGINEGYVSTTAGSTTVTGSNTAFASGMVGSVIRIAASGETEAPGGPSSNNPAAYERIVTAVASATSLTVDSAIGETLSSVPYLLSDPIDIEISSMYEYFCRECEKQWRMLARSKAFDREELAAYERAWQQAREADNHSAARQASMRGQQRRSGFDHYPMVWNA